MPVLGVHGNTAYPFGDGGFEALITQPRPSNFQGQPGWWTVPQQWYCFTDANGQIWVSPDPFPASATQAAPIIAGSSTVHFTMGPPVASVTFIGDSPHGLSLGDQVTITGAAHSFLNGTFTVSNVINDTAFNYQITNQGAGTFHDSSEMQGAAIPTQQPSPRYAAKVNIIGDGAMVFFDMGRNTRTGNLNPYFYRR